MEISRPKLPTPSSNIEAHSEWLCWGNEEEEDKHMLDPFCVWKTDLSGVRQDIAARNRLTSSGRL